MSHLPATMYTSKTFRDFIYNSVWQIAALHQNM